uniref:Nad-binding protein n=1 Tax=Tetraselmis sp. GSL018 TaxID=582737 RepID=A0A061QYA3_9CHLO
MKLCVNNTLTITRSVYGGVRGSKNQAHCSAFLSGGKAELTSKAYRKTTRFSVNLEQGRQPRTALHCVAEEQAPKAGTPVPKTSLLVVGGTGTLGRQVVRKALDDGYDVRCIVRPRPNPADFLRDWGVTVVNADLTDKSSIPAALVGVHTIIDCSTARPEESTKEVDWEGKVALIQCAQAMGIQRFIFCSIHDCDKHPNVPLMNIKSCTEKFLAESGLNYTVLRMCGFMQAVIGNYAVPVLEEQTVWGTSDSTKTAYLDAVDAAKMVMASLRSEESVGRTLTLSGPESFTVSEVIGLCEELSDSNAQVSNVPVWLLKSTRGFLGAFQWAKDAADRLAFADLLSNNADISAPMEETYKVLGLDPAETTTLRQYLTDYYTRIMKKLKEVNAESKQTNFYI